MIEQDAEEQDIDTEMKHPPYHLRTNKSVDRLLLVETIRALGSAEDYQDFTYYSLAGPFLEDLRVIDHFFPRMRVISFESNFQTHQRQELHRFNSALTLLNTTLTDFLAHNTIESNKSIFWLDYTGLEFSHFGQFQSVLDKVAHGSIVRITLRAQPVIDLFPLEKRLLPAELTRMKEEMQQDFYKEFLDVLPSEEIDAFANLQNYARMVQLMIRRAASNLLDSGGTKNTFLPVQSTRYDDNTQMLSVTGVVCQREDKTAYQEKLSGVRFASFEWEEPTELNIPALSLKERLRLENRLPVADRSQAGDILHEALGYNIDRSVAVSKKRLAEYAYYYRDYPHFVKMWD